MWVTCQYVSTQPLVKGRCQAVVQAYSADGTRRCVARQCKINVGQVPKTLTMTRAEFAARVTRMGIKDDGTNGAENLEFPVCTLHNGYRHTVPYSWFKLLPSLQRLDDESPFSDADDVVVLHRLTMDAVDNLVQDSMGSNGVFMPNDIVDAVHQRLQTDRDTIDRANLEIKRLKKDIGTHRQNIEDIQHKATSRKDIEQGEEYIKHIDDLDLQISTREVEIDDLRSKLKNMDQIIQGRNQEVNHLQRQIEVKDATIASYLRGKPRNAANKRRRGRDQNLGDTDDDVAPTDVDQKRFRAYE